MSSYALHARRASAARNPLRFLAIAALLTSAAIHASLISEHLVEKPVLGWLFVTSVAGLVAAAAATAMRLPHWRAVVALLLAAMIVGYLITRLTGYEGWDTFGVANKAIELVGLGAIALSGPRRT